MTLGRAGAGVALGVALVLRAGAAHGDGIMLVEAGAFSMGSDGDDPNEAPQHRTYVRDFWIERDKVTNLEFARFLNAWGTKSPEGEDYFDWDDADVRIHGPGQPSGKSLAGPWAADSGFEHHPRGRGDVVRRASFHRIPLCNLGRPGREMRQ